MSSKSSRRRTASADVESADVEPNPVDEPTVTDPQAVIQEIIETKAEVEIVDELLHTPAAFGRVSVPAHVSSPSSLAVSGSSR